MNKLIAILAIVFFAVAAQADDQEYKFDETKWEKAKAALIQKFQCPACKPEHIALIQKAQLNPTAIRYKYTNILWSAPSTNRLQEYMTKETLKKVGAFVDEHEQDLCKTYDQTNVDPMVVTSLLYMETLFGSDDIPWFKALNSIVSLAVLSEDEFADDVIKTLMPKLKSYDKYKANPKKWSTYDWQKRAKWIAGDWTKHLVAYLTIANLQNWSDEKVLTMKSSWAGAIGYSQFMPNTALPYFEEQKTLDFWQWPDSFMLTSLYLRDKGFAKNRDRALEAYNAPKWYRDTITHQAHVMRKKHPHFCKNFPLKNQKLLSQR
jgi:membrane-bound lytic murein transglycosylase B